MTPEEALKHIEALVQGIDEHSKPAILLPTIKNIQELVRKVKATATKGR